MMAEDALELSFDALVERYFSDASRAPAGTPYLRLVVGACDTGALEPSLRDGHVRIDALDVFNSLRQGRASAFPGPFVELLDIVGSYVAARALRERRHILTVLPDDTTAAARRLLAALLQAGYRVEVSHAAAPQADAPADAALLAQAAAFQCVWLERAAGGGAVTPDG